MRVLWFPAHLYSDPLISAIHWARCPHRLGLSSNGSHGLGIAGLWLSSYLSDRSQAVVLKNGEGETAMSNVVRLSMGVPQGSVLGPPLHPVWV